MTALPLESELPLGLKKILDEVVTKVKADEEGAHTQFCEDFDHRWKSTYEYESLKSTWRSQATAGQRRDVIQDAQRKYGQMLWAPLIFANIETLNARLIAQDPRIRLQPLDAIALKHHGTHEKVLQAQFSNMNYGLSASESSKTALIGSVSIRKNFWRREVPLRDQLVRGDDGYGNSEWFVESGIPTTVWDDPFSMNVHPKDFIIAHRATSIEDAPHMTHRIWQTTEYCMERIHSGVWDAIPELKDNLEETRKALEASGEKGRWDQIWGQRGNESSPTNSAGGAGIHEILEYHDRKYVYVILDRKWPVRVYKNPHYHQDVPFSAFRPIHNDGRFYGISLVKMMEPLQDELAELKTQRRDNVYLQLEAPFVIRRGAVNPTKVRFGRRSYMVTNGPIDQSVKKLEVGDVPYSGYKEEEVLKQDLEIASGMMDNGGGVAATATEAQLQYQQMGARIGAMLRRFEREQVARDIRQAICLNQQHIRDKEFVVPGTPVPGGPEKVWELLAVTNEEMQGRYNEVLDPNSMGMENVAQDRADSDGWLALTQSPLMQFLNPEMVTRKVLELKGAADPSIYMSGEEMIPATALQEMASRLEELGIPAEAVAQAMQLVGSDEPTPVPGSAPVPGGDLTQQITPGTQPPDQQQPAVEPGGQE